jgi:phosphoglucomutase
MGEDFSFKNVRIFAQGYANYLKYRCKVKYPSVAVNFDTRFLSDQFALESAKIFSLNGIKTYLPERDAPLAPVSLFILRHRCRGGINFTASFNRPIDNGIKVFTHKGVPPLPEETDLIEKEIKKIAGSFRFKPQYPENDLIDIVDMKQDYIDYLEELIDFEMIKDSGIKIVVDNLYGTSREYLDFILSEHDIDVVSIHGFPYADFGGMVSSCDSDNLKELSKLVVKQGAHIGLATDIDGDRFGIVDANGRYLDSNIIMPPLIEYLIKVRKMEGGIVKSISTTVNIRKVAEYYLRKVYTTPVGFKFLADVLHSRKVFVAVESSNGASLNTRIKIKDGILFNLLITEMLAYYKLEMDKILEDFYFRFPHMYSREISIRKNPRIDGEYRKLLRKRSFDFSSYQLELKDIDYVDGIKFKFGDAWLLIRESGTNPVFRIYAESTSLKQTKNMIKMGRSFIE